MIKVAIMKDGYEKPLRKFLRSGLLNQFLMLNSDDKMLDSIVKCLNGKKVSSSVTICNEDYFFLRLFEN